MKDNFQTQIREIMENFDFDRTHEVMAQLRWTWYDSNGETPTVEQLKETARFLLQQVTRPEVTAEATGGFYARREETSRGPRLSLSFSIDEESASVGADDGREGK